jgi:hypothetical protein
MLSTNAAMVRLLVSEACAVAWFWLIVTHSFSLGITRETNVLHKSLENSWKPTVNRDD